MWLKITIVALFIAMLFSLSGAFVFLMKDQTDNKARRTLYTLGIRIGIAVTILGLIAYGLVSGTLRYTDPFASLLSQ